jgi:hypothetical protein
MGRLVCRFFGAGGFSVLWAMMADSDKIGPHSGFRWTRPRLAAALLLAEDELSDAEIAERVGVARSTLSTWKANPEFAAQVGDHIGQLQAAMLRYRIAKKRQRARVLDELHTKLLTVIEERAGSNPGVAGDETGLILHQIKSVGGGPNAQIIDEYVVDTGTVREIRALEEQAAKELGQWVEKSQIEDATRVVEIVGITSDAI